jgi:uncharacterized protein CbrC (UPF0167 family)
MSVSFSCHCSERKKPVRERAWVVIARRCNHSAFNGYHFTPSEYSEIFCPRCRAMGRTKAKYVSQLQDGRVTPLKDR